MTKFLRFLMWLLLVALLAGRGSFCAAQAAPEEFFEKRIRPLLVEHCYKCHGPTSEVDGGLKLTSREALLAGGDTGPAVVTGQPDRSLLIAAVQGDGLTMPPDDEAKLSSQEIDALRQWIALGVPWPSSGDAPAVAPDANEAVAGEFSPAWRERLARGRQQWSLRPVQHPPLPAVQRADWAQREIDTFVLSALEAKGLTPSPPAERPALLRRVSFDLTGLPPTPAEVADFLADTSPGAWAKVIDRLLASPHYGERWARHWLDVARYADTRGYSFVGEPGYPWAFTYRDYVIRALNEDLPYDRFILEQLAADALPLGDDKRALAAMGFLTVGNVCITEHDRIDDQIDVVMRGLQGLSVTCARCHDHKFDPIPTRDYYSLYGVMASSLEPLIPPLVDPPPATSEYESFARELAARQQRLAEFLEGKYTALEQSTRDRLAECLLAVRAMSDKPATDDFQMVVDGADLNPRSLLRWKAYLDRSRRMGEPIFALWHALSSLPPADFAAQAPVVIARFAAEADSGRIHPLILAAVKGSDPISLEAVAACYGEVFGQMDRQWRYILSEAAAHGAPAPCGFGDPALEALRQVFYGADSPTVLLRTAIGDLTLLPDRASQAVRNKLLTEIDNWKYSGPAAPPRAMVMEDRPVLYDPHVFGRGNHTNLREAVPRQFLHVLTPDEPRPFSHGSGRLDLAQAIANRDNPLTARVMVNRVWQHHFGAGLVRTPSDFGVRGEPPTHPELLDFLASTFMDEGWSLKKLHRRILLSATYCQASADRTDCQLADPENRLLWKYPRLRLDFESLRDSLLAVSGRLDPVLYGPPHGPRNQNVTDAAVTRRTIYCQIDRLNLPALLRTFDFPNPDSSSPQRDVTTVPQQGLFLLNNLFMTLTAQALFGRVDLPDPPADPAEITAAQDQRKIDARVDRLYRLLFARPPEAEELNAAHEFLGRGQDLAIWYQYAQGLLLTNEFAFTD